MLSAPARALLALALVAGCKPEPHYNDAQPPDAGNPWWSPKPGEAADWDIQLKAMNFDVSMTRAMMVIDLWDAVPAATMLTYADGVLAVAAGVHPMAIGTLKSRST